MRIEEGECLFCSAEGEVGAQSDAEICHRCARKVVIAFAAKLHNGMDAEELEALKEAGRALVTDTKRKLKNLREAATPEDEKIALEDLFPAAT